MKARPRAPVAAACWLSALSACAPPAATPPPDLDALRHAHEDLHHRLDERIARVPHVREVLDLAAQSDVVVGLRSGLVEDLVQEVAGRYLDRVELELDLDTRIRERRAVEVATPLGRVRAGEWELHVIVHRVQGALRARLPEVRPTSGNRLELRIPVVLEGAQGTATARFRWDARSVAGVVCRDFEVTRSVRGQVLGDEYVLAGQFELTAGPQTLLVQPVFPARRFRLRVDLVPDSWSEVKQAIEEQDQILRCGMAIDTDEVMPKLKELLQRGFDVRLPRSLFRAVELPASVRQSVTVEGQQVDLVVRSDELRVTPQAVWYSASVRSRLRMTPSPATTPSPPPTASLPGRPAR